VQARGQTGILNVNRKYASERVEMAELQDYSGSFNPKIRYEDFSKEIQIGRAHV
jgi:hypothetical protein